MEFTAKGTETLRKIKMELTRLTGNAQAWQAIFPLKQCCQECKRPLSLPGGDYVDIPQIRNTNSIQIKWTMSRKSGRYLCPPCTSSETKVSQSLLNDTASLLTSIACP